MKFISSRGRVAVLVGAIATMSAVFAPSAVAKPTSVEIINCETDSRLDRKGVGTVNLFPDLGMVKGHCFFENGFPDVLEGELEGPGAAHVSCNTLAEALGIPLTAKGKVTLTPSGHVNVNCHKVG